MNNSEAIIATDQMHTTEHNQYSISVDGHTVKLSFPTSTDDKLLSDIKDTLLRTLFCAGEKK